MPSTAGRKEKHLFNTALLVGTFVFGALFITMAMSGSFVQDYFYSMNEKFFYRITERFGSPGASHLALTRQQLLNQIKQMQKVEASQLRFVNDLLNRVPQVEDIVHWGVEDYWATPAELVASNGGDCEDFVIAKYAALRAGGIPPEKMRLTYVKAYKGGKIENHMILAYYPNPEDEPLILDNLETQILPASKRPDLLPVYEFNGELSGKASGTAIRNWDALVEHMHKEFE